MTDSNQSDSTKGWKLVPIELDVDMSQVISAKACSGAEASQIWHAAVLAAPVHPIEKCPQSAQRLKVCEPGYIGPANLQVVRSADYDALLALINDPMFAPKYARRLIEELRGKVAELEKDKARLDFIEQKWFFSPDPGEIEFSYPEGWSAEGEDLRSAIDTQRGA